MPMKREDYDRIVRDVETLLAALGWTREQASASGGLHAIIANYPELVRIFAGGIEGDDS